MIDTPVLTEFRKRGDAQGIGYQTLINDALRDCLGIQPELNADIRKLVRQEVKAVLGKLTGRRKRRSPYEMKWNTETKMPSIPLRCIEANRNFKHSF